MSKTTGRHKTTAKHEYPFSKAKNLIGVVESGIRDLGQHHRKHLVEKIKASRGSDT